MTILAPKPVGRRARKPGIDRKPRQAYSAKQLDRLESEFKVCTMLQKLSKCEFKANFTIYLPLRFYVKSNFGEFKRSKMSFLALLEVLNFNFSKFEPFLKSQINQNSKLSVYEIVK